MEIILQNPEIFIFAFLASLGYGVGTVAEKRHYRSIRGREESLLNLAVTTTEEEEYIAHEVTDSYMVMGSVVVSIDYFKRLLAILRNIFGGTVKSYETLVDRARREAILRMKEEAHRKGADIIINLRLETAAIGFSANHKRQIGSVEAIAYGTALKYTNK